MHVSDVTDTFGVAKSVFPLAALMMVARPCPVPAWNEMSRALALHTAKFAVVTAATLMILVLTSAFAMAGPAPYWIEENSEYSASTFLKGNSFSFSPRWAYTLLIPKCKNIKPA